MPEKTTRSRRTWIALAVLLVLNVPVLYLIMRRTPPAPPPAPAPAERAATRGPDSTRAVAPESQPASYRVVSDHGGWKVYETVGTPSTPEERQAAAERAQQALDDYLKFAKYPPWSRPADDSQRHLWEWNEATKAGQEFALDKDKKPISGDLTLDRMFAAPGEAITATVTVWSGIYESEARVPVPFTAVGLISTGGLEPKTVGDLVFAPVPGQPAQQALRFVPSSYEILQARNVMPTLIVAVKAGDRDFHFSRPFRYTATPPFVIKSKVSEKVVGGNLEVRLAGLSQTPQMGGMRVQATLFDADGKTPIAVYDHTIQLSGPGEVPVVLTFFGKIIRERNLDGPYSIRALHGIMVAEDEGGLQDLVWKHEEVITTSRYAAKDFGDKDWNAPEKQDKINRYQDVIKSFGGK